MITLKAARANVDLTLEEAAEKIGVTSRTLSSWEKAITFPTVPQITAIEGLYGVSYNDIIFLPDNVGLNE